MIIDTDFTHAHQAMRFWEKNDIVNGARWDERHLVGVIDETITVYDDGSVFAMWPSEQGNGSPRVYESVGEFRKHNTSAGPVRRT